MGRASCLATAVRYTPLEHDNSHPQPFTRKLVHGVQAMRRIGHERDWQQDARRLDDAPQQRGEVHVGVTTLYTCRSGTVPEELQG